VQGHRGFLAGNGKTLFAVFPIETSTAKHYCDLKVNDVVKFTHLTNNCLYRVICLRRRAVSVV